MALRFPDHSQSPAAVCHRRGHDGLSHRTFDVFDIARNGTFIVGRALAGTSNKSATGARSCGNLRTAVDAGTGGVDSRRVGAAGDTPDTPLQKLTSSGVAYKRTQFVHLVAVRTWREVELDQAATAEFCIRRVASRTEMALHRIHLASPLSRVSPFLRPSFCMPAPRRAIGDHGPETPYRVELRARL